MCWSQKFSLSRQRSILTWLGIYCTQAYAFISSFKSIFVISLSVKAVFTTKFSIVWWQNICLFCRNKNQLVQVNDNVVLYLYIQVYASDCVLTKVMAFLEGNCDTYIACSHRILRGHTACVYVCAVKGMTWCTPWVGMLLWRGAGCPFPHMFLELPVTVAQNKAETMAGACLRFFTDRPWQISWLWRLHGCAYLLHCADVVEHLLRAPALSPKGGRSVALRLRDFLTPPSVHLRSSLHPCCPPMKEIAGAIGGPEHVILLISLPSFRTPFKISLLKVLLQFF